MRLAVIGANGRTGSEVVERALQRGHEITAIARRPEQVTRSDARLTTVAADALDRKAMHAALVNATGVVSALGVGSSRAPTTLYSEGIANVISAMDAHGIARIAVVSAVPAGPRAAHPPLERRVLLPILDRVFGATYEDMRRMEGLLLASNVDWVALRPPRLVGKPATGRHRVDAAKPLPKARSLTYGDLAEALLDAMDSTDLRRTVAYVAN